MGKLLHKLERCMDDFKIKKKFYVFYIVCVLIPLIITDSVVFYTITKFDRERKEHEMANIASAVEYSLSSMVGNVGEIANSIYTNRNFDDFLSKEYADSADYVSSYQSFLGGTLLENALGMNNMVFTLYTDNDTIVNGGRVNTIEHISETEAYKLLNEEGKSKGIFFVYDDSSSRMTKERRIIYLQKLDFFDNELEKYLKIEFDYSSMVRTLKNMNYDNEVIICEGNKIVLSNGKHGSYGSDFQKIEEIERDAYVHTFGLYGTELEIYVKKTEDGFWRSIKNEFPIILLLVLVNALFPFCFVQIFNRSFTKRITELSRVFKSVDSDHLIPMHYEGGKDEISSMIQNYNRMVKRTNELIQTVYKNRIKEQEMLVGRKNAELLALHSQINPHFLFNVLESIRMHSILKKENETADMVAKLAVMERQYVEWGNDSVSIAEEIEFVKAYLALQKYRFGDRLNYSIDVNQECSKYKIPKLTIVTFVENACVHGIESKSAPGWIFVRINRKDDKLCIEVEDTGSGMEEGKLLELEKNMQNANIEMLKSNGRVGIINACVRLKLITDNRVEFQLEGEEGIGTTIVIHIPLQFV
ncbi:MAG: sensor histidine kinase [Roseburia sp.]